MTPKITVVTPLYNKEEYIAKTIASVLSQTFTDFEYIIVNDGSTDKSADVVNSIHDERIILMNQKNSGQSTARNNGIKHANAELIAFLDADDEWTPDFLETVYELYQKYPDAGIYGTGYSVYINNQYVRDNLWKPELGGRILPSYFEDTVKFGTTIFHSSCFAARRSALLAINGYQEDYRSGQDHDLYARMALYYPIAYVPKVCSRYNAGLANNCDKLSYAREVPMTRYLSMLPENERNAFMEREDIQLFLSYYYLKLGGINIYGGFRKEGREQVKLSTDSSMKKKRLMFLAMSYIPFPYYKISPKLIRNIANKMKMAT